MREQIRLGTELLYTQQWTIETPRAIVYRTASTQQRWHMQYGQTTPKVSVSAWDLLTLIINSSVCAQASSLADLASWILIHPHYSATLCSQVIMQLSSWGNNWELFRLQYRNFGNERITPTQKMAYAMWPHGQTNLKSYCVSKGFAHSDN